jgi:signal transduction histidine kinase
MEIAPEAVEAPEPAAPLRSRATENPLVRAVGRIPLPLRAKLLIGFALVAGLLALSAGLGLVALNQSNSRGEQLKRLQQTAAYAQLLAADANQLIALVGQRGGGGTLAGSGSTGNGSGGGIAYDTALDNDVFTSLQKFTQDVQQPIITVSAAGKRNAGPHFVRKLQATLAAFQNAWDEVQLSDTPGSNPGSLTRYYRLSRHYHEATQLTNDAYSQANTLAFKTSTKADALIAENHGDFASSRNLLIGVAGGSLALAIAIALLLSWSVVTPLRRTESRLDEIAAGEFSGRLEVANRDEIGALVAKVNRMSDELQRVYRELEVASQHKSDFLATMSHELRTPLNAIIGFSEVLQEQMFGELNERQVAYVNDILEAGRHLLALINDVLDLAKIEAGRMELELSQVEIPDILKSAVSIHSEHASRGGIELDLGTEPDEITVTADERRVRQIVFNLVSNAVKFTPAGGRVGVSAHLENGQVEIAVADTGPGIAAEDQRTIFEEFEQTTEGKQAEGTGLGLPLSRKLVELHGGRLWVESEVGHGSTFRFTLPVEPRA